MNELQENNCSAFDAFVENELDMGGLPEPPPDVIADDSDAQQLPAGNDGEMLRASIVRVWTKLMRNDGPDTHWYRYLTPLEQQTRDTLQELLFDRIGIPTSGEVAWTAIGDCIALSWLVMTGIHDGYDTGLDDERLDEA